MPKQKESSANQPQPAHPRLARNQIVILVVVAAAGILFYFKGLFIAAMVNSSPISRLSVVQQLEKTGGKQTLDSLVTKELLLQEAKKKKITVSDQEINKEISKIEASVQKQGGTLDQALQAQGMTKADLKEQVKLQKILEKMFIDQLKATDKEIDQFIEENKDNLPPATDSSAIRESVRQQLQQNKLGQKVQKLISTLKKAAKINYFINY